MHLAHIQVNISIIMNLQGGGASLLSRLIAQGFSLPPDALMSTMMIVKMIVTAIGRLPKKRSSKQTSCNFSFRDQKGINPKP